MRLGKFKVNTEKGNKYWPVDVDDESDSKVNDVIELENLSPAMQLAVRFGALQSTDPNDHEISDDVDEETVVAQTVSVKQLGEVVEECGMDGLFALYHLFDISRAVVKLFPASLSRKVGMVGRLALSSAVTLLEPLLRNNLVVPSIEQMALCDVPSLSCIAFKFVCLFICLFFCFLCVRVYVRAFFK